MIKYLALLRKKPDWTDEAFRDHWKQTHGPLVAQLPGLVKYVQYHVHSQVAAAEQVDDPIQGIAEMWFESEAALKQAMSSPVGQQIAQDVAEFLGETNHFNHLITVEETLQFV